MSKRETRPEQAEPEVVDGATALKDLRAALEVREAAEHAEREAVLAARAAGVSWTKIGELYGLTKQGAQQRFKKNKPASGGDSEAVQSTQD